MRIKVYIVKIDGGKPYATDNSLSALSFVEEQFRKKEGMDELLERVNWMFVFGFDYVRIRNAEKDVDLQLSTELMEQKVLDAIRARDGR